jgi:pilus assembly protein CpaE
MTQHSGLILSEDSGFRAQVARMFRSGSVPIKVTEERLRDAAARSSETFDVVVVDIRGELAPAMAAVERLRARLPGASILAIADTASSDLILQAMRAGANEFLDWPPSDDAFQTAVRRIAGKRETNASDRVPSNTLAFFGAKGGAGTTTMAVNCGVELARLSKRRTLIVDLKAGLGEVALFLGVRPRYSVIDAIDNLHRLDQVFLKQLVIEHKSGLGILAGSDLFDRPGAADSGAIEALLSLLARQYEYVVIDAGSQITPSSPVVFQSADRLFLVANPDVPCVRNAQRLLERVRKMGTCGDRTHVLLNRAAEPYPIPLKQIESALGQPIHHTFPSDYKTVSTALNSGVPLARAGDSDNAAQFDQFTRRVLDPSAGGGQQTAPARKSLLSLDRLASLW